MKAQTLGEDVRGLVARGDVAPALELFARNWRTWLATGDVRDGMAVASLLLDATGAGNVQPWRARVLYADGLLAFRAGDMVRSRARNEELLRLARATGDARGECDGLTGLARIALREGRYEDVVTLARDGRGRARAAGDPDAEDGPRHLEAVGVRLLGDYDAARELYLESLAEAEKAGNADRVASEDFNLGWVELHRGDVDAAEARFRSCETSSAPDPYLDAWRDLSWSAVACLRNRRDEARRRFEAGARALDELEVELDPDDALELEWLKALLAEPGC